MRTLIPIMLTIVLFSCSYITKDRSKDWQKTAEAWRSIAGDCIEAYELLKIERDSLRLELDRCRGILPKKMWNELQFQGEAQCQKH